MKKEVNEWIVLDTGISTAEENMRIDAEVLENLQTTSLPVLHLYDWKGDCATYGYLVDPYEFLDKRGVQKMGLQLARRPTGGGIIFHIWDLAFSVAVPAHCQFFSENTLANYEFVNQAVLSAVKEFMQTQEHLEIIPQDFTPMDVSCKRFCMAQPTKYDVVYQGKKIAGAAQRKTKKGFLHQGTISLMLPSRQYLHEVLKPNTDVLEAMFVNTFALLGPQATTKELEEARCAIKQLLIKYLTREF
jgi:lipoate-protein ligase A